MTAGPVATLLYLVWDTNAMERRDFLKGAGAAGVAGLAGLAGCTGATGGGGTEPLTVGLQADLTGPFANIGFWHERTVTRYVEALNEDGGIGGREVDLTVADTATDTKQGVQAMRDLAQQEGADVIIGSQNSGVAIASAPVARQTQTPYFSIAQAPSITGADGNRWVFRPAEDVDQFAAPGLTYGVENLGSKWTVMFQDYAFGQQFRDAVQRGLPDAGGEVLTTIPVPLGTTDLTSQLNRVPDDTEVLFAVLVPPTSLSFLQQSADLGTPGERFGPIQSVETVDVSTLGPGAEGATFLTPFPREVSEHDTEGHRHLHGLAEVDSADTPPLSHYVWSYEALSVVRDAVEGAGYGGSDDAQALVEWLEGDRTMSEGTAYPQGDMLLRGADHQAFVPIYLEQVEGGTLRLRDTFTMDEPPYDPRVDFTTQSF